VAAAAVFGVASVAFAEPVETVFEAAPDLTVVQSGTPVLWQVESTPCAGNDGGSPTLVFLDPGCAVRSNDPGAVFFIDTDVNLLPGLPPGADLTNGLPGTLDSDGTTATMTIDADIWGPVIKAQVDSSQVTVTPGTVTDYVFTIDVATGLVTTYTWGATIQTILGPGALSIALEGADERFYSSEPVAGPDADGAVVWICGGGGVLAQPNNDPEGDPASIGTCPPDDTNPSPTVSNAAWDPVNGTIYANASSATLVITPRAWAPIDGRISVPEPGAGATAATLALLGLGWRGHHRR
jgi:hypothetical protein